VFTGYSISKKDGLNSLGVFLDFMHFLGAGLDPVLRFDDPHRDLRLESRRRDHPSPTGTESRRKAAEEATSDRLVLAGNSKFNIFGGKI
jgi:hypothetical protein